MQKKLPPILDQFLPGLALIALGVVILCWKTSFLRLTLELAALVMIVTGITMLVMLVLRRGDNVSQGISLFGALISIGCGILAWLIPDLPMLLFGLLFSLYVLINGAAKMVTFILFAQNKVKGRVADLFDALLFLTFGILLLFTPLFSTDSILIIIAIYSIILGSFLLLEFLRHLIPKKARTKLKRKVRISLPVFMAMLIPYRVLKRMDNYFAENPEAAENPEEVTTEKKPEALAAPPDLEVYIHVSGEGDNLLGHCNFLFDGKVISYGNYDESSRRVFGGAGDGVLFFADPERYIPFVLRYSKKTIFGFGFRLTGEQKARLRERLEELTAGTYRWLSPYEVDEKEGKAKAVEYYGDYASHLHCYGTAEHYKFTGGRFKTYFVMSTNCVELVDHVLSAIGTDIVKINGIITPGTYYDYLDNEFKKPDSMVISRTVYLEDPENKFGFPREEDARARARELAGLPPLEGKKKKPTEEEKLARKIEKVEQKKEKKVAKLRKKAEKKKK